MADAMPDFPRWRAVRWWLCGGEGVSVCFWGGGRGLGGDREGKGG